MIKNPLLPLLILMSNTQKIAGIYECCPDENILFLSRKSCSSPKENPSDINLECPTKLLINDRQDFVSYGYRFLDNSTLLDKEERQSIYCHSTQGDDPNATSPIYILCVEESSEEKFEQAKIQVQAILGCVSACFVILTIIVYALVPSLLDLQGICMMHTLVGLACVYIFLSIIQLESNLSDEACKSFAYLVYFCSFYLFFWLAVLSFHIWRTTVKPNLASGVIRWPVLYHIFAIGGSVTSLIIILTAHYSPLPIWDDIRPGFGEVSCWFKSSREQWIYFYVPLIVMLIINGIFYLWTVLSLWKQAENSRYKILKYRLKLCVRLCVIMGVTWVFEILTFSIKGHVKSVAGKIFLLILPDMFNILQGISIFLVLVVFRKRVRRALASKNVCNIQFPNSWKYLSDEEMESAEEKANGTVVEYKGAQGNSHEAEMRS